MYARAYIKKKIDLMTHLMYGKITYIKLAYIMYIKENYNSVRTLIFIAKEVLEISTHS